MIIQIHHLLKISKKIKIKIKHIRILNILYRIFIIIQRIILIPTNNTNIKIELNSSSLNKIIKEKKETFNKICDSINKILNKYKYNKKDSNKNIIKESNDLIKINKKDNINRIAEHLIKTYTKEELKLIKDKINIKVEEDEEPKPEILLSKNLITNNNEDNKKKFWKKINKNYKPIKLVKLKSNNIKNKNMIKYMNNKRNKGNNLDNNFQLNPLFLTYIKCKTSFECLNNIKQKRINNKNKNNTSNISLSSNKNSESFLIKQKIKANNKNKNNLK